MKKDKKDKLMFSNAPITAVILNWFQDLQLQCNKRC
jgi:hypothetical protein